MTADEILDELILDFTHREMTDVIPITWRPLSIDFPPRCNRLAKKGDAWEAKIRCFASISDTVEDRSGHSPPSACRDEWGDAEHRYLWSDRCWPTFNGSLRGRQKARLLGGIQLKLRKWLFPVLFRKAGESPTNAIKDRIPINNANFGGNSGNQAIVNVNAAMGGNGQNGGGNGQIIGIQLNAAGALAVSNANSANPTGIIAGASPIVNANAHPANPTGNIAGANPANAAGGNGTQLNAAGAAANANLANPTGNTAGANPTNPIVNANANPANPTGNIAGANPANAAAGNGMQLTAVGAPTVTNANPANLAGNNTGANPTNPPVNPNANPNTQHFDLFRPDAGSFIPVSGQQSTSVRPWFQR
ncbi:hypothetical protein BDN72DRAFT_962514 [Pluteus cervinus]|uniref:Uncharacterized protein n=1 Tax=Pluteus cervinus TaxID=181527 RepID=A0ACD3AHU2_9AGAR|nr:hypothetical protein BDN72DRAFT_962514 [Pluteus cervinus]